MGRVVIASPVVRHVLASITPASAARREHARASLDGTLLQHLVGTIAGAQHGSPRVDRRALVVALGDHGAGDPGISMGKDHPTATLAHQLADGRAALCALARSARADLLVLDCGCAEPAALPRSVVRVGRRPSGDARQASALTPPELGAALEAGIAVAVSLADAGLDVLAVGALGLGADVACTTVTAALLAELEPPLAREDEPELVALGRELGERTARDPWAIACAFAGPEQAVLVGLLLAAASMNVPVILDGETTLCAALLAVRLCPASAGYLVASQSGHGYGPQIARALGAPTVFGGGVGLGEGAGAAMVLALLEHAVLAPAAQ